MEKRAAVEAAFGVFELTTEEATWDVASKKSVGAVGLQHNVTINIPCHDTCEKRLADFVGMQSSGDDPQRSY